VVEAFEPLKDREREPLAVRVLVEPRDQRGHENPPLPVVGRASSRLHPGVDQRLEAGDGAGPLRLVVASFFEQPSELRFELGSMLFELDERCFTEWTLDPSGSRDTLADLIEGRRRDVPSGAGERTNTDRGEAAPARDRRAGCPLSDR